MIEDYSFGQMIIDGREYSSDLLIYPDGKIQDVWHRGESHKLFIIDIEELLATNPEILVVGTGASGFMEIEPEVVKLLQEEGVELYSAPTREASEHYNEIAAKKRVAAAFHLTC